MNLRHKVKLAKKQLSELENAREPSSTYEILERFYQKKKLEEIIQKKTKPTREAHWNEEREVNWDKLTYVSFMIDGVEKSNIKTPNGKILNKKEIADFIDNMYKLICTHSLKVIDINPKEKVLDYVSYYLLVSDEKTKQKVLQREDLYFQNYGSNTLSRNKGDLK